MSAARVLILSVGAGSGHNRAAQALEKAFAGREGVEQVEWLDCLEYTNPAFREMYSRQFLNLVQRAPVLWGWAFEQTDVPWEQRRLRELLERLNTRPLVERVLEYRPTICVCTHFMPAAILSRLLRDGRAACHLSVIVTDFYVHASWLTDPVCRYFVAHQEGGIQLQAAGFEAGRISVTGIPIDEAFGRAKDRPALRAELGAGEEPVVLFSAGAAGTLQAPQMVGMMDRVSMPCRLAIVCGRNERLKAELETLLAARPDRDRFIVMGYTTRMHDWMAAADLFIGKPGGLTTSECLASGLPVVIWDPVPGQEMFNAVYLLENGAGVAPTAAATMGYKIDAILRDSARLVRMRHAAQTLGRPTAAVDIASTLLTTQTESPVNARRDG